MLPYINPNYFNQNQYQPLYQMPQMQTPPAIAQNAPISQSNTQIGTIGRVVDSIDVVRAMEVPMDGQTYYFPKADGSCVYSKRWLPDGTTNICAFSPDKDALEENADNLPQYDIKREIGAISDEIKALKEDVKSIASSIKPVARVKKGALNESDSND